MDVYEKRNKIDMSFITAVVERAFLWKGQQGGF